MFKLTYEPRGSEAAADALLGIGDMVSTLATVAGDAATEPLGERDASGVQHLLWAIAEGLSDISDRVEWRADIAAPSIQTRARKTAHGALQTVRAVS